MLSAGGAALRFTSTFFYALEFLCAALVLGVYSYFLARLSSNDLPIDNDWKATEGLSGAAVIYTLFAVLLTCFLGGKKFFAGVAIFLDVLFCGAFIGIAVLTRDGASSCSGSNIDTPLGSGPSSTSNPFYGQNNFGFSPKVNTAGYSPNLHLACRLNTAAFAVAVIGALLMLVSAAFQVLVARHHQKEKKYGPSPANNYTSGSGNRKFWQRKQKTTRDAYGTDAEASGAAGGLPTTDMRVSQETGYTGTTMAGVDGHQKYETTANYTQPATTNYNYTQPAPAGNYHTGPRGTAVPSYGYDNQQSKAANF